MGLKENVIVGHLIPAGTGQRRLNDMIVNSEDEYQRLVNSPERKSKEKELAD
jgi:DNA-directed RNA polymerase subunit beta'